jgi:phage terminase large subunit-like protein
MTDLDPQGFPVIAATLTPPERRRLLASLIETEAQAVEHDWDTSWAHGGQKTPPGDWQTWVIMAGRGFGKTRTGAEWVARQARADGTLRIALVAATLEEARRIMVEGESGLIAVAADRIADWSPSRRMLRFVGGAEATLFSGASPGQVRGPQHHIAWCDELAKWEKPRETWDMLQLGLRLGTRPRILVTTTPKTGAVLEWIKQQRGVITTGGNTYLNPHVSDAYKETIRDLYEGTRLGRQEIDGELLPPAGALWTVELIEACRMLQSPSSFRGGVGVGSPNASPASAFANSPHPNPVRPVLGRPGDDLGRTPEGEGLRTFTRTLIAVDPPTGEGTCGIIACARDTRGHVHVLADHSVTGQSPEGWAAAVGHAAAAHDTREVIAEANQGGRMVKSVLLTADPTLHVRLVHARDGKAERADPVAHLFQAGKAWFAGRFPELEAQLLGLIAGGGYDGPGLSPDRADAMVWGLSMLTKEERVFRISTL